MENIVRESLASGVSAPARLKACVTRLAGEIGERNIFKPGGLDLAYEYIKSEFIGAGYEPKLQEYHVKYAAQSIGMKNVSAVLPCGGKDAQVIAVGAHYDTAPGTPGADDNASGIAVLLELARRLRGKTLGKEVHFAAFSTEEPPFFGTRDMGSFHYASGLNAEGRKAVMICLEMLGYYSGAAGSQKYPFPLGFIYPSKGDFIGFVSNLGSRKLLKEFKSGFTGGPVVSCVLPGFIRAINLSDHLSFWRNGFKAVMVTDTAFFRNSNYHRSTDTPETLDYNRMADITDGLENAILRLAK